MTYKEHKKELTDLIDENDTITLTLTKGLIEQASLLYQQICDIQDKIKGLGHIQFKKDNPAIQRELPASKVLTRLQAQYNATMLAIHRILSKSDMEEKDDDFDRFQKSFKDRFKKSETR
jgi:hypothetical protein